MVLLAIGIAVSHHGPMSRVALFPLCGLAALLIGCATTNPYLPAKERAALRSIGVVALANLPQIELGQFRTKGQALAAGTAAGLGMGLVAAAGAVASCGLFAPSCPAAVAAFYGSTALGVAAGAQAGLMPEQIASARTEIGKVITASDIQEAFARRILEYTRDYSIGGVAPSVITGGGKTFEDEPAYPQLAATGLDSVLEVSVLSMIVKSTGLMAVEHWLEITARARLVRLSDRTVLQDGTYFYSSERRPMSRWLDSHAQLFHGAFQGAFRTLAQFIADENLLLIDTTLPPDPDRYPALTRLSISPQYPPIDVNDLFGFSRVESLRPTLRWEDYFAYPELAANQPGSSQRSYELRLVEAVPQTFPGVTIFAPGANLELRRGLTQPHFTPEKPLRACTKYFWTVRARWVQGGMDRSSEWAGRYTSFPGSYRRALPFAEAFGSVYRTPLLGFETPCAQGPGGF